MQTSNDDLVGRVACGAFTRRRLIQGFVAIVAPAASAASARARNRVAQPPAANALGEAVPYSPAVLPPGIRSRFVNNINGLRMHVLEAGFDVPGRPGVVLLHGFPELAYSWRKVMVPIASAGFHVIAPDLRGYGRTTGTNVQYDEDLGPFRTLNEVRDIVDWYRRSATAPWRRWSGTTSGRLLRPGAPWCGRTCSAPSR